MFRMFRLGCWQIDESGQRKDTTIFMNPEFVMGIEKRGHYAVVFMTFGTYYTTSRVENIEQGLSDVSRLNKRFVSMN